MEDRIRVTVIATGFPSGEQRSTSSQQKTQRRKNVLNPNEINSPSKDNPAFTRHDDRSDVEVAESDPDEPEETTPEDEDEDLSIPTFMRVGS